MARRSLQASTVGIEKAKKAFKRKQWTQDYLASEVGIETRQPVWKFFTGKPVERQTFMEICFQLNLDWQEIADLSEESQSIEQEPEGSHINALVQNLRWRRQEKIQSQCGSLRLLNVAQSIELEDLYININIVEKITGHNWLDIDKLQECSQKEIDSFDFETLQKRRVPGMQAVAAHTKLMIVGKPGAGKTTFLRHIAIQCNQGELLPDYIPIFIRLRNFAENAREANSFSLFNYLNQELSLFGADEEQVKTLLHQGRALILLDGLDEVNDNQDIMIVNQVLRFCEEYYKTRVIMTCRVANHQYQLEGFTDIEIADFDYSQIAAFVQKWFIAVDKNSLEQGKVLAAQFMQKLQLSENQQIRNLVVTPLLLNLACCVFQSQADFSSSRLELYKNGLNILLRRWDEARSIKREENSQNLSLPSKFKLLSQIAAITFEQGHYFFTQEQLQHYITNYLQKSHTVAGDPEVLQVNSEVVLKSLEAQGLLQERARGVYSFSHLTFQEYLTARNFVFSSEPQTLEEKLQHLVSHLTEARWRNVFLFTASMLGSAPNLLQIMKQYTDMLAAADQQLQDFLIWLKRKTHSVQAPYKSAAIRAFYLTLVLPRELSLSRDLALSLAIAPQLFSNLAADLALDLAFYRALSLSLVQSCDPAERVMALSFALPDDSTLMNDSQRQAPDCSPHRKPLQQLQAQLPSVKQTKAELQTWWDVNGQDWSNKLRLVMLQYRNIGHQWQFNEQQQELLIHYYAATQLLVDCLKNSREVPQPAREQIEEALLLPIVR